MIGCALVPSASLPVDSCRRQLSMSEIGGTAEISPDSFSTMSASRRLNMSRIASAVSASCPKQTACVNGSSCLWIGFCSQLCCFR